MSHQDKMLQAVRVIARHWSERGTTRYPLPFVGALSTLFREAYFVEHGEYPPDPAPTTCANAAGGGAGSATH